ncbi:ATPase, partial [Streptomyces sp. NPDC057675]
MDTWFARMPINTRDEIGELARAFDRVHLVAVEQAPLRASSASPSTTLSRHTQALIADQLALLADLKTDEADPQRLTDLDDLGRLAARARRHTETLLSLAGWKPNRCWDQPVPLIKVLLAARSEVEDYQRIKFSDVPKTKVHSRAVTDLVHILAELLENATTLSPPQDNVRVAASRTPNGLASIEVHDRGIGLTSEDGLDINEKPARPPVLNTSIARGTRSRSRVWTPCN